MGSTIGSAGTYAHGTNHSALAAVRRSELETTSGAVEESTVKEANVSSGKKSLSYPGATPESATRRGITLSGVPSGRQLSAPPASSRT